MTELERHIAKLLQDNDCVIVPGFGGFMAHHIAASYDEKSHIFLPPTRTVGFNPRLTMNDSVLAQDYVSCYDLSYPEALKRIESEVDEFRQMILGEDGGHELCGIGRLYALENGEYDFIPNDNGITTPATYGFQAFELDARSQRGGRGRTAYPIDQHPRQDAAPHGSRMHSAVRDALHPLTTGRCKHRNNQPKRHRRQMALQDNAQGNDKRQAREPRSLRRGSPSQSRRASRRVRRPAPLYYSARQPRVAQERPALCRQAPPAGNDRGKRVPLQRVHKSDIQEIRQPCRSQQRLKPTQGRQLVCRQLDNRNKNRTTDNK